MRASELMARAENALRTGQTENLFPVIARRCLELIEEEKQANRREWVALVPSKQLDFTIEAVGSAFRQVGEAVTTVVNIFADAFSGLFEHDDFALANDAEQP